MHTKTDCVLILKHHNEQLI